MRQLLAAVALACLLGACSTGTVPSGRDAPRFAALVESRRASVVDITALRFARGAGAPDTDLEIAPESDFADRLASPLPASLAPGQIRDLASGVILASDGLILTSAHVVADIDEAQVRLADGRRFTGRVVGIDRRTDVALLKIAATGLPTAPFGDSARLAAGDWVAAIGAPFGFRGSVTAGVVSATNRYLAGGGDIPFIQTDVAINPGSSGSPLFNERGEVVAINSMIYSGSSGGYMGLSFAVPINLALKTAGQLRSDGRVRRAWLGAELQEVTPALAGAFGLPDAAGALVVKVDARSPAQAAGLARGDIVTALDGVRVDRFAELVQRIADRPPGSRATFGVWRRGSALTLIATLAEQTTTRSTARPDAMRVGGDDGLGLTLGELSKAQRLLLGVEAGLLVREAFGAARSEGLRAGDVVVAVNTATLERVDDFVRAVALTPVGQSVALLVLRDRRLAYVAVRVPPR
ncbi:trypsin-like peptidase domain-containing protein [Variovorax sp. J22G21]|uniref:trypsin-like peptidase domain-containing protein n=1 Tax=Variovorax fucosicus TaxID=3053517 RepID=UPI0025774A2A|nr:MULTISPECIES: trypsin-like peptidase domain-containing protein [unclassified Variovorax]MDM0041170.1 trypsin-like peptidase domain-containing protein [Variovorax sp. J22R193]MDM0060227.1 trypsin-like peptidase domain-containing protein [Variovorax sp. J22G21]